MSNLIGAEALWHRLNEDDLRVVDTRFSLGAPEAGRAAYTAGHIPGAVFMDLDDDLSSPPQQHGGRHPLPDMSAFARKLERLGISNSSRVVAYDDASGVFAGRLWWLLKYAGHDRVQILDGGFPAWTAAGYGVSKDVPGPQPGVFTLDLRPEMLVGRDYVLRNLDNPNVLLLDTRASARYRGDEEPLDPVGGHIPGALNRPYSENLQDGRYKSPEALRAAFGDLELGGAEEVVVYCGSGVSASHNLIALEEAGIRGAKLYAGSWSDWSSYADSPVAQGDEP